MCHFLIKTSKKCPYFGSYSPKVPSFLTLLANLGTHFHTFWPNRDEISKVVPKSRFLTTRTLIWTTYVFCICGLLASLNMAVRAKVSFLGVFGKNRVGGGRLFSCGNPVQRYAVLSKFTYFS